MKRISAILVFVVGALIALLVILSPVNRGKVDITTATERSDTARFNFLKEQIDSQYSSYPAGENAANLTNSLTQAYLEEVIKRNPDGPQLVGDIPQLTVPSEEMFQELLSSYLNTSFEWERITEKDVKISSQIEPAAYLKFAREVLDKKSQLTEKEAIALSDFLEKGSESSLRKVIEEIHVLLRDVLTTPSPPSQKEFHVRLANFLEKQTAIYDAVLKANDDPMRAVLAVNEFPGTSQELESLREYMKL